MPEPVDELKDEEVAAEDGTVNEVDEVPLLLELPFGAEEGSEEDG